MPAGSSSAPSRDWPRTVFLDLGGTLVQPRDVLLVYEKVLGERDLHIPRADLERVHAAEFAALAPRRYAMVGRQPSFLEVLDQAILRTLRVPDPEGRIVRELRRNMISPEWVPPFPESEEVLSELRRRGSELHLLSGNFDHLPGLVRALGWEGYFRTVTFSQETGAEKPDPQVFRFALRRAGVEASGAVYVGDTFEADVEGALGVGMRAVWVNRSGRTPPRPCASVRDLRELPELFYP